MTGLNMHGPLAVRHYIRDFLAGRFPALLVDIRAEWGLDSTTLPDPQKYVPHSVGAVDVYPTILVATGIESTTRRVEHELDGGSFVSTYPMEIYAWTIAPQAGPAEDLRDRMATAMKIALLGNPTFGGADIGLNESTFTQSYSEITKSRSGDRFVGGSQSAFDVVVYEGLGSFGSTLSPRVDTVSVYGVSKGSPFEDPAKPLPPPPVPMHPAYE